MGTVDIVMVVFIVMVVVVSAVGFYKAAMKED